MKCKPFCSSAFISTSVLSLKNDLLTPSVFLHKYHSVHENVHIFCVHEALFWAQN